MARPLRVAYFTNSIAIGGMEKHVVELASSVARLDCHVSAIVPGSPAVAPFTEWLRDAGIHVDTLDLSGAQPRHRLVANWLQLRQLLRAQGVDVFHQHRTGPYHGKWACLAARAARVPAIVATEHLPAFRLHGASRLVNAIADHVVDRVVTVCELDRRQQLRVTWRPEQKVVTIHNGVALGRFRSDDALDQRARVALGVTSHTPILGVVARLTPAKGITYLLKALPALISEWPGLILLVAGEGEERGALEQEVSDLGIRQHVRFLGQRNDVDELLRAMHLLVLPSEVESFPVVILEAMAMSRACVGTDVGGVSEAIVNEVTGLVVPPRDPVALAAAIGRLLREGNLDRMGAAARTRVEQHFTAEAMAVKTVALYRVLTTPDD